MAIAPVSVFFMHPSFSQNRFITLPSVFSFKPYPFTTSFISIFYNLHYPSTNITKRYYFLRNIDMFSVFISFIIYQYHPISSYTLLLNCYYIYSLPLYILPNKSLTILNNHKNVIYTFTPIKLNTPQKLSNCSPFYIFLSSNG